MMKLKSLGLAVLSATALMAFASTASATTLSVTGVTQTGTVTIHSTLASATSYLGQTTGGTFINTCTAAGVNGWTTTFTGTTVGGETGELGWAGCTEGNPTVDNAGTFSIERIAGTSNGTLRSSNQKVTWPSFFGPLTCTTTNTDFGQITGVDSGNATIHINAVINCGIIPSTRWTGTYTTTTPDALTVVA